MSWSTRAEVESYVAMVTAKVDNTPVSRDSSDLDSAVSLVNIREWSHYHLT